MHQKNSSLAWVIWILSASFFFVEYIVRVSPSVMSFQLMKDFHITAYDFGVLSAFFYYAYIPMQIPVGVLVDRFSVRWLLGSMALLCAASSLLLSVTETLVLADIARFLIGITGAFAFVGALKIASTWFSSERFGFLTGATQALGMLGASVGGGPLSLAVVHLGWRPTLMLLGGCLSLISMLIYAIVRSAKNNHDATETHEHNMWRGLKKVLTNPLTWINGLFVGLLYAPTGAFGELWGAAYLERIDNISAPQAASVLSFLFIGWAIGSPLFGWVSDKIKRRKIMVTLSAVLSLIFMTALLYAPFFSLPVLILLAFLYGLSNVGVSLCYVISCEVNSPKYSGTALGFANMASIIIGTGFFQPLIGWVLDHIWNGTYKDGAPFYSAHDFRITMIMLPVALVACVVLSFFLKESYKAPPQKN